MTPLARKISDQLDAYSQTTGAVLIRTDDGWTGVTPGGPGYILVADDDGIPAWIPPIPMPGFDTGWIIATLENGWQAFGAPWGTAEYRALASGVILVQGSVKNGGTGKANRIFQLPAGFRPDYNYQSTAPSSVANRTVQVDADGDVYITSGSNTYIQLMLAHAPT